MGSFYTVRDFFASRLGIISVEVFIRVLAALLQKWGILATVAEPKIEALEAIGGTGDTLTGIVAALVAAGLDLEAAAILALKQVG